MVVFKFMVARCILYSVSLHLIIKKLLFLYRVDQSNSEEYRLRMLLNFEIVTSCGLFRYNS
uniref:Uncharacterized protein n=1 Tax=Rhizophagus irregularis (strain DAOM 181602 / DAOM 197198 / MUCL 43194) TaxID=747089 RepID=U9UJM5_RHIID